MVEQQKNTIAEKATAQNWFVAIDGSEASEEAFQVTYRGLYRSDKDHITIGHITDRRKEYLPFNLKPEYLSETYTSKIALPWAEKKGDGHGPSREETFHRRTHHSTLSFCKKEQT